MTETREASGASEGAPLEVAAKDADRGFTVDGRHVTAPEQGFGRLWRNEYVADLGGTVSPEALAEDWKANFGEFWPKLGRFHPPRDYHIQPGVVAPLELGPSVGPSVTTGVVVVHTDERSFTFVTPEGHMFAALITFSVESELGRTIARISIRLRTNDPLYELAWPLLKAGEDIFWPATLRNLAAAHGVEEVDVQNDARCLDQHRIWRNWPNVRHNAVIHSAVHGVTSRIPFRRA